MRNGTSSPLSLTRSPTRGRGRVEEEVLEVSVVARVEDVGGVELYGEVDVVRSEIGGCAGRAFFGKFVEMRTGSSGSRR